MIEKRPTIGGWPLAAAIAAIGLFLYAVRYALLPFILAASVGFAVEPLISWSLTHTGGRRWPMAIFLFGVLVIMLAFGAYWIAATVVPDFASLMARAPEIVENLLSAFLGKGIEIAGRLYPPQILTQKLFDGLHSIAPALTGFAGDGLNLIFGAFLTLVLIPYFMLSGPRIASGVIWLLPPERRMPFKRMLLRVVPTLRRYLVGILVVFLCTAVIGWVGFGPIFRLPHAVVLAITVGVLEIVPAIGPVISAILVGVVAVEQEQLLNAGLLMAFVIALRILIDNLIGPIVLGRSVNLHPVVVMFAFVCGAMLFGIVGLLLAVPVASSIKIGLKHVYAEMEGEPG